MLGLLFRFVESVFREVGRFLAALFSPSTEAVGAVRTLTPILLGLAVFIPAVVLLWSLVVSGPVADKPVLARLAYANERSMGVEIVDRDARYLGMIHYKADPKFDYVEPHDLDNLSPDIQSRIAAYDIRPDHKTIHVTPDETPDYFWRCLKHLEDRAMGTWRNPAGIDFWTAFKIPFNGDGGSTIPMMISRHMRKTLPRADEPVQGKIWRKFKEWEEAPAIWRSLGAPDRQGGLKAWSAQHVVLLTNLGGAAEDIIPDVYGVQTAGRLLFGKTISDLSPAEQMMLAAAYRRPLVPYRETAGDRNDPALAGAFRRQDRALKRWSDVSVRARACATAKARILPARERAAVDAELLALAVSPPRVAMDPDIFTAAASLFRARSAETFALRLEHPYSRLRLVLPRPHRRFVTDLLTDRFGRNWRDQVRRLDLTLDMASDLKFQKVMDAAWSQFEAVNAKGWLLAPASADLMGYVVAVADDRGRIVRFHEGGARRVDGDGAIIPRFEGGSARYPGALIGGPVADLPRTCTRQGDCTFAERDLPYPRQGRELASVGKVLAAIALADSGGAPADAIVAAFAKSDSTAIERALTGVAPARLRELMSRLGVTPPNDDTTPLSVAISRGYARASPREAHRMIALALAMARNRFDDPVYLPTLVASYDLFDTVGMTSRAAAAPDALDRPLIPRELLVRDGGPSPEAMSAFVRRTLSAPVCSGGTLSALKAWCPDGPNGVALHIAKTGTRANARKETVDIWIAGGVEMTDGRAFTYVVLAGTNQPSRPFHNIELNARSAASVVDALLKDVTGDPGAIVSAQIASTTSLPGDPADARPTSDTKPAE